MKFILSLSGLMLLFAAAANGAGTLINTASTFVIARQARAHMLSLPNLSEPAALVALGVGFVLLANQVRRKKC
jgi:hypothetical protein